MEDQHTTKNSKMTVKEITEQMNSDIFDGVERAKYDVSQFSQVELMQAKQAFKHCNYDTWSQQDVLEVTKNK